jgi:sugar phosphate isomerase/epimerase
MYTFPPECAYMQENWRDEVKKIKALADELKMEFVQAHSIGGNPLNPQETDYILAATIRSIEICEMLGIKNTVVHNGMAPGLSKAQWFQKNKEFYEKLFPTMERCGVNVLCENSTKANMGDLYYVNSGKELLDFVEYVDHPLIHACWDTGHGNLQETTQFEALNILGKDAYALHVQDNFGKQDQHLVPFCGCMDMDSLMRGLNSIGYNGYFTFESTNFFLPKSMRKEQFADGVLKSPSLEIKGLSENLLYEIGKFILTSYNQYEE